MRRRARAAQREKRSRRKRSVDGPVRDGSRRARESAVLVDADYRSVRGRRRIFLLLLLLLFRSSVALSPPRPVGGAGRREAQAQGNGDRPSSSVVLLGRESRARRSDRSSTGRGRGRKNVGSVEFGFQRSGRPGEERLQSE